MASRKILVVDDSALFRDLESLFLARSGHVSTAASGEAALDLCRVEPPDVVVADLDMPGLGGDGLCRELRRIPELAETPVLLVTSGAAEDRARAVRAGADDVVTKPLRRIELIGAVSRLLRPAAARGLGRVALQVPVHIQVPDEDGWGTARNLSRGGMFIESPQLAEPDTEVQVDFRLPNRSAPLVSTAKVVWCRPAERGRLNEMGLQFLALDRETTEQIAEFVEDQSLRQRVPTNRGAAPST